MPNFPADEGLRRVLTSFEVRPEQLLGNGGEAWVYALDDERVVRVLHAGGGRERIERSDEVLRELQSGRPPFRLPETLEVGDVDGRWYSIERRLPGQSLTEELRSAHGPARAALIEAFLNTSSLLGDLPLRPRGWFGDLVHPDPIRVATWREYLILRAERSLRVAGPDFASVDPSRLAAELPDAPTSAFVHLDLFPGNVLVSDGQVEAVIDFGTTTLAGDRRIDPLSSAVYLTAPAITPTTAPGDAEVAQQWLRRSGLDRWFEPAQRWLAAFWAHAVNDVRLHRWCRDVLLD